MIVAIVSSLYEPHGYGGAERVAQSVAETLAGRGHRVHVICLGKADRMESAELNGVRVHYCPLRNLYWPFPVSQASWGLKVAWHAIDSYNLSMARAVADLLDEIRPEVVNSHNIAGFSSLIWEAAAERGLPLAHTLHDHYLLCPYSTMFRNGGNCAQPCLRCRVASVTRRSLTRHVDSVIGVSRYILDRHLDQGLFAQARASVVYNGFEVPQAVPPERAGAATGRLRIGYLGTLVPSKGLDRLVDAFLGLAPQAAELRIGGSAGDPGYVATLKSRSASRDDIRWLGAVRSEDFLRELDVLVAPSIYQEPMPRVVIEAFCQGVPVVAARRGGIPEGFHGECGWLYDPDDTAQLPAILKRVIAQRGMLGPMRGAAYEAARNFSIDAMAAGYLAAYRDAAERRSQAAR